MMDINIYIYLACIIGLVIIGKIFAVPLIKIIKLVINSILGGILIYIINLACSAFSFHLGLNFATAIFVGLLGVPGAVLLVILKMFIG